MVRFFLIRNIFCSSRRSGFQHPQLTTIRSFSSVTRSSLVRLSKQAKLNPRQLDYRHIPSYPVLDVLGAQTQVLMFAQNVLYQLSHLTRPIYEIGHMLSEDKNVSLQSYASKHVRKLGVCQEHATGMLCALCVCCTHLSTQGWPASSQRFLSNNSYLTHLPMEGDGSEPEVSEQQSRSLSVVTGAAEYHKGVASQFIENINQVGVLNYKTRYKEEGLET